MRSKRSELQHDAMCDIQIAVGEALTNAYRHGSPEKGKSRIGLKCSVCDKVIVLEVQDEGEPFDSGAVADPIRPYARSRHGYLPDASGNGRGRVRLRLSRQSGPNAEMAGLT